MAKIEDKTTAGQPDKVHLRLPSQRCWWVVPAVVLLITAAPWLLSRFVLPSSTPKQFHNGWDRPIGDATLPKGFIHKGVERIAAVILGTPVTIDMMNVDLLQGTVSFYLINITTPPKSVPDRNRAPWPHVIVVPTLEAKFSLSSCLKFQHPCGVIDELKLFPRIFWEGSTSSSSVEMFAANLRDPSEAVRNITQLWLDSEHPTYFERLLWSWAQKVRIKSLHVYSPVMRIHPGIGYFTRRTAPISLSDVGGSNGTSINAVVLELLSKALPEMRQKVVAVSGEFASRVPKAPLDKHTKIETSPTKSKPTIQGETKEMWASERPRRPETSPTESKPAVQGEGKVKPGPGASERPRRTETHQAASQIHIENVGKAAAGPARIINERAMLENARFKVSRYPTKVTVRYERPPDVDENDPEWLAFVAGVEEDRQRTQEWGAR